MSIQSVLVCYIKLGGLSSTGSSFGFVVVLFAIAHFRETGTLNVLLGLLDGWVYEV